jgi:hypothetical protein
MLKSTAPADFKVTFTYGRPKKGHGWHAVSFSEMIKQMAAHVKATAPAGEDTSQWNY